MQIFKLSYYSVFFFSMVPTLLLTGCVDYATVQANHPSNYSMYEITDSYEDDYIAPPTVIHRYRSLRPIPRYSTLHQPSIQQIQQIQQNNIKHSHKNYNNHYNYTPPAIQPMPVLSAQPSQQLQQEQARAKQIADDHAMAVRLQTEELERAAAQERQITKERQIKDDEALARHLQLQEDEALARRLQAEEYAQGEH